MLKEIKDNAKTAELKVRYPLINVVIVIVAIIMLWRGVWGLLNTFLFPGSPVFSYLASVALGVLILYLDDFKIEYLKR